MKWFWTVIFVLGLGVGVQAVRAEVSFEVFEAEEWMPNLHCQFQEFPLSIHEGINTSSIDSVVVKITGISSQGSQSISQGHQWTTYDCWDGWLVRFDQSCSGYWCDQDWFSPDGLTDYVAGSYVPTGDNEYFEASVPVQGLERTACCSIEYSVTEPRPDFESLFSQDEVYVRISQVSGGPLCLRCMGGLATIDTITVSIFHGGSLPVERESWGFIKAHYR